ncbi:MAG: hypothetical protein H0V76_06780 [Blastocatellia bacterium]|nr:hypothetical protein [Blastocatellia bacterium]
MSKTAPSFYQTLAALGAVLQIFTLGMGQGARIEIDGSTARVSIDLDAAERVNVSFLSSYAGVDGISERVTELKVFDTEQREVNLKRLGLGEYLAERPYARLSYSVNLEPLSNAGRAHVSWIDGDVGVLVGRDLLPIGVREVVAALALPSGWELRGTVPDARAVKLGRAGEPVYIGRGWRVREDAGGKLTLMFSGEWRFTDEDAMERAREIFAEYERMFGAAPSGAFSIAFTRLPQQTEFGVWNAETRGRNVLVASSDMPFGTPSVQRMHEQLRHEIFHFWIPNGVNLSGNYDWFYEGFALYQSLKIGVKLKRIRFEDMLITLSQAMRMADAVGDGTSLIDATRNRWTTGQNAIYARGLAAAFYIDLSMMNESRGRRMTDDIVREIYAKYSESAERRDGNEAVLEILTARPELRPVVNGMVNGTSGFDAGGLLTKSGFVRSPGKLETTEKPNGRQREILRKLGYNGR